MHIAHFNDQIIDGLKRNQLVLGGETAHLKKIGDDRLQLWMIKPRHLGYFSYQDHYHL